MKTKILSVKGNWQDVVDDCRTTVGKDALGKEPSEKFKKEILISEHSPIRSLSVRWKWECFIKTQRTDRTGEDRNKLPQDSPVIMTGDANTQHLIDMARKRLCRMASKETRKYMEDLKIAIHMVEPEVSNVLVPNCVYRCGCPETTECGFYKALVEKNKKVASIDIQERYDAYNEEFYGLTKG